MNARLVLACAFSGVAVVLAGGGIASAEVSGTGITFSSDVVAPGERLQVTAFCDDPHYTPTPIRSQVIDPGELGKWTHADPGWSLRMSATVVADASPEIWPVTFTCAGEDITGYLRVGGGDTDEGDQDSGEGGQDGGQDKDAQVPVKPKGAPETGSLPLESGELPVGVTVGVGAVLLGVGGLGTAALARRRRA
jgi:hypothetical protein